MIRRGASPTTRRVRVPRQQEQVRQERITEGLEISKLTKEQHKALRLYNDGLREHLRFPVHFATGPVAGLSGFRRNALQTLQSAIEAAVDDMSKEEDCFFSIFSIYYVPIPILAQDKQGRTSDQLTALIGTILLEPVPHGGTPRTTGRMQR